MLTVVRFFESEEAAQGAVASLTDLEFRAEDITTLSSGDGDAAAVIDKAIRSGVVPGQYRKVCTDALASGHSLVAIEPPFGRGDLAKRVMAKAGAVGTENLPEYIPYNPSPLSDFLGIPTLVSYKHSFNIRQLSDFSLSGSIGFGELSKKPTPLSSMVGMKTLTTPKPGRKSSFGMPLLSKGSTPLSSMIGMKMLTTPKPNRRSSFGFPLLSNNKTPLSSLFNFPLLSKRNR